jgi:hypothetical protein
MPRARLSTALELGIAEPLQRARVQVDLAYVLGEIGRSPEAGAMFAAGLEAATNLGDRALAAQVLLQRTHTRLLRDPGFDATEAEAVAKAGMETFRELGDQRELALAERRLGLALLHQGRVEEECAHAALPRRTAVSERDPDRRRSCCRARSSRRSRSASARGQVVTALLWAAVYGAYVVMEAAFDAAGNVLDAGTIRGLRGTRRRRATRRR